jgi:hypothetical protein
MMSSAREVGDHEVGGQLPDGRMHHEHDRDDHQRERHQRQAEPFESAEAAGADRGHNQHGREDDGRDLRQPEVGTGQADADELGDDGQRVEHEQVDDTERAPELSEPFQDEAGVPDSGHRAQTQHHLLVDE